MTSQTSTKANVVDRVDWDGVRDMGSTSTLLSKGPHDGVEIKRQTGSGGRTT